MALTAENMESRNGLLSHSIYRDIARMDETQLGRYTRMAFTGQRDLEFLPAPFWYYWFDASVHGSSADGRDRPSPADFLAGFHNTLASVARGTFRIGERNEPLPDFGYRPRFRGVITAILDECLDIQGTPTEEQQMLAVFAVEAVGIVRSSERERKYGEGSSSRRGKEQESVASGYSRQLAEDLELLTKEYPIMAEKAHALIRGGKFGDLKLGYDSTYI